MKIGQIIKYTVVVITCSVVLSMFIFVNSLSKPIKNNDDTIVINEISIENKKENLPTSTNSKHYKEKRDSLSRILYKIRDDIYRLKIEISREKSKSPIPSRGGDIKQLERNLRDLEINERRIRNELSEIRDTRSHSAPSRLKKGYIGYEIPDSMTVEKISRVAVSVSNNNTSRSALINSVAKNASMLKVKVDTSEVSIEEVKVGQKMSATLSAPNNLLEENFKIEQIGKTEQILFEGNDFTASWQWDVIPLKEGNYPLNLIVEAVIIEGKEEFPINIPVFTKEVLVVSKSNFPFYYLILGLALVGIFVGYILKRRRIARIKIKNIEKLDSKNITQTKEEIKNGNTEKAINIILENCINLSDILENELTIHLSEFNEAKRNSNMGIIRQEEKNRITNRINLSILQIIQNLENKKENSSEQSIKRP